jgi:hypothetical protein
VVAVNKAVTKSVHSPLAEDIGSISIKAPTKTATKKLSGINLMEDILEIFIIYNCPFFYLKTLI